MFHIRQISRLTRRYGSSLLRPVARAPFCEGPATPDPPAPEQPLFTQAELDRSPLDKSTYMKLVEQLDEDTRAKFDADLELGRQNRLKMANLDKEIASLKTVTEKNRESLTKFKEIIENERAENTRLAERMTREIEKEKVFAISNFSKEVLEVVDNLDRLLKQYSPESETSVYQGVQMVRASTLNVLKRFGISPMPDPLETQVDPSIHEIVFHAAFPGKPDGYVLDVSQTGFFIGERVLRPAKVGVVKNMS